METAARKMGHMVGWQVGSEVQQEVFARAEYRDYAQPGDYTRTVIVSPERIRGSR